MIEKLEGLHEIINYKREESIKIIHNRESEDYPEHWHKGIEIIIPVKNDYKVYSETKKFILKENDILLINSCVLHRIEAPENGERIIIQFPASILYEINEMKTILTLIQPIIHINKEDELYMLFNNLIKSIILEYNKSDSFSQGVIYSDIIKIYANLGRSKVIVKNKEESKAPLNLKEKEYIELIMKACSYINDNFKLNINLDVVAEQTGFSKFHFTRLFKNYMNTTFYEYLNEKRMKCAQDLLYMTDMNVTDIAMNSGFSSLCTFNRNFKQIHGCSPSDFRKKMHG